MPWPAEDQYASIGDVDDTDFQLFDTIPQIDLDSVTTNSSQAVPVAEVVSRDGDPMVKVKSVSSEL